MVFEIDQDSNVVHIKSLEKPQSSKKAPEVEQAGSSNPLKSKSESEVAPQTSDSSPTNANVSVEVAEALVTSSAEPTPEEPWPEVFNTKLSPFLTPQGIEELKKLYLEGPEPPLISDGGWAGRAAKKSSEGASEEPVAAPVPEPPVEEPNGRGGHRGRGGRGRDKRGGRGGGRGGFSLREDTRKVVSEVRPLRFSLSERR